MKDKSMIENALESVGAEVYKKIKSGEWEKEPVSLKLFFNDMGNGVFEPNDLRIQVRQTSRDVNFIERVTNEIVASGNTVATRDFSKLQPLVLVLFPKEGVYKILNGNHTSEIAINGGLEEIDAYIVNFETQLNSSMSEVMRLGNLLNRQDVQTQPTLKEDVRGEVHTLLHEKEQNDLEPKLTESEIQSFLEAYPFVTRASISQFVSYWDGGARSAPMKTYNRTQLKKMRIELKNNIQYKDYVVLSPRTLKSWSHEPIATAFSQAMKKDKRDVLIPFYCKNRAQVEDLKNGLDETIISHYENLNKYFHIKIKTYFAAYE